MLKKSLAAILLLIALGISACQPTPEEPFVVSKGDGELQKILSGNPAEELTEPYSVPLEWRETVDGLKESKLIVEVDASITVPQALTYPVFRATQTELTQEIAENFISFFIGDKKLYDYEGRRNTDAHLQAIIDMCEYQLNDTDSPLHNIYDSYPGSSAYSAQEYEEFYEFLKNTAITTRDEAMEQLVKSSNRREIKPEFVIATSAKNEDFLGCTDGLEQYIEMRKTETLSEQWVKYYQRNIDCLSLDGTYAITNGLTDLNISIEEAKEEAFVALQGLGYSDWNFANGGRASFIQEDFGDILYQAAFSMGYGEKSQRHWLTYTPPIFEDIPLLYFCNNDWEYSKNQTELREIRDDYAPSSGFQPSLHFAIGGGGINYAVLNSCMAVLDTVNTNVPLLPFEKIQEVFHRYIVLQPNLSFDFDRKDYNTDTDTSLVSTTININDIRLGYMKVREKDVGSDLLVPVWMFYGIQHDKYTSQSDTEWALDKNNERIMDTPAGYTFLIINAIDGSIIDPLLGY